MSVGQITHTPHDRAGQESARGPVLGMDTPAET